MSRHQQAVYNFAADDMVDQDLSNVGLRPRPIPDAFGVDDDTRAVLAMIEASRLVGANDAFKPEPVYFLFHKLLKAHRTVIRARPPWVALGTLVDAHEDVTAEVGHIRWKSSEESPSNETGLIPHHF